MEEMMGYWSMASAGDGGVWGDAPADVFDVAIKEAAAAFKSTVGREPTLAELRAGFEFSLGAKDFFK
jgi:hypothetical protein